MQKKERIRTKFPNNSNCQSCLGRCRESLHVTSFIHLQNFKSMDNVFNSRSLLISCDASHMNCLRVFKSFNVATLSRCTRSLNGTTTRYCTYVNPANVVTMNYESSVMEPMVLIGTCDRTTCNYLLKEDLPKDKFRHEFIPTPLENVGNFSDFFTYFPEPKCELTVPEKWK